MADVILFHPKIGPQFYLCRKTVPLRLLKIATFVHQEYKVKIIDQMIDKNWEKNLLKELKKNPLCVGITAMAGMQIHHGLEASKIVKENSFNNVKVVEATVSDRVGKSTLFVSQVKNFYERYWKEGKDTPKWSEKIFERGNNRYWLC
jgi:hypothetical protein